jgi:hypothetical protein
MYFPAAGEENALRMSRGANALIGSRATGMAWTLCGVALLAATGTVALSIADAGSLASLPDDRQPSGGGAVTAVVDFVLVAAFGVVGAVVASHRPRNPVGWLLCGLPPLLGMGILGEGVYWHATVTDADDSAPAQLSIWFADWWWTPVVYMVFVFLPLLFPTGGPVTPRWRIVVWIAILGCTALVLGTAFYPGPLLNFDWVDNPLGIPGLPAAIGWFGMGIFGVGSVAAVASLAVRFRRARGAERQQLKWLTAAASLLVATSAALALFPHALSEDLSWVIFGTSLLCVDLAVALAVMRYRLYDIDVVINRALVYGALTATLAGTYLGSVLLLQLALSGVTGDSGLAVAASTLAVAALFRPARARIQTVVDRRFYRRRYDAQRTLDAFAARLRDEVALDALTGELRGVVAETMQPAHVSLWLREAQG